MSYALIKAIHISCVIFSLSFFSVRAYWTLTASDLLQKRWVRILPHFIDTLLLGSAIVLAIKLQQYPLQNDWLTAKLIGLLLYIGLGHVALKSNSTEMRFSGTIAALAVATYMVSVALTKSITPWH